MFPTNGFTVNIDSPSNFFNTKTFVDVLNLKMFDFLNQNNMREPTEMGGGEPNDPGYPVLKLTSNESTLPVCVTVNGVTACGNI